MIGQQENIKLLQTFKDKKYNFIIIQGARFTGKTTLVKEVYNDYNIIDCNINKEGFEIIKTIEQLKAGKTLLLLQQCDKILKELYNEILKLVEDGKDDFVLVMEYLYHIPTTLQTRAKIITMDSYEEQDDEICKLADNNEKIISIATSPGEVLYLKNCPTFNQSYDLGISIADNIKNASIGNVLKITKMFEEQELDLWVILNSLIMKITENKQYHDLVTTLGVYGEYTTSIAKDDKMFLDKLLLGLKQ